MLNSDLGFTFDGKRTTKECALLTVHKIWIWRTMTTSRKSTKTQVLKDIVQLLYPCRAEIVKPSKFAQTIFTLLISKFENWFDQPKLYLMNILPSISSNNCVSYLFCFSFQFIFTFSHKSCLNHAQKIFTKKKKSKNCVVSNLERTNLVKPFTDDAGRFVGRVVKNDISEL